jgi:imidazolonepropionase
MTQLLARAAGQAAFCDVFCDAGAFSPDECRALLLRARELGFGLKLHAEQLAHSGGARLAAELGATSADHLENATPEDMGALAAAEVTGVLLPGAHLSMRGPTPDARAMLRHGMTLALATDCNPGTSHTTDMRLMIALAVGTFGLTPLQALTAATRGAALALGLVDRGSVAPGMRADLLILDADTHVDIAYRLGNVSVKPLVAQFLR